MSEQQMQELQNQLIVLKSRVLDLQDHLQSVAQVRDSYAKALQEIVGIVGMETSAESVQLADVVDAVKALVNTRTVDAVDDAAERDE